jgi:hypothetical protein
MCKNNKYVKYKNVIMTTDASDINDIRQGSQFRGISFSNFKKLEVKTQFIENIKRGKVEPACYWCAELICAGHYMDVWETIIHYVGKYIHLGNPKLVIYLDRRYLVFKNIIEQGHFLNELQLRNNLNIRKMFAEIVCILTISNKKPSFECIKINREDEFDITQMTERLIAPSMKYIDEIFLPKDPKELFIALNEFAYNISDERNNMSGAFYWIEWIIEFDIICKKRKTPCYCEKRRNYSVDNKLQTDVIWIVWDTIFYYCEHKENKNTPFIKLIMKSLLSLFSIKYTTASCKKRKYLLYYAIELLTEPNIQSLDMISDKTILQSVVNKINNIYKQIKTNEECPNTDYLFANLEQQNTFDQSMLKIEMINNINMF